MNEGIELTIEVFNIPWEDEFEDLDSAVTRDAIYLVQKHLDEMFIDDEFMWADSGFVRSRVKRFAKGSNDLRVMWLDIIASSDDPNATDIHEVFLSENAGDPYIDIFEPTEAEVQVKIVHFLCIFAYFFLKRNV